MGYHKAEIPKGVFGQFSKIEEEFLELKDAMDQKDRVLATVELCDLLGAIEGFAYSELHLSLEDLVKFSRLTQRAFETGHRK